MNERSIYFSVDHFILYERNQATVLIPTLEKYKTVGTFRLLFMCESIRDKNYIQVVVVWTHIMHEIKLHAMR